ncbi:MAG: alpha/beta hydrolase [Pseudomonadota bacterium]
MPQVAVNGVELTWERLGRSEDPAVLLIMGFSMQMTAWPTEFCDALVAAGLQVIRFDNRDIGLSSRLGHLGRPDVQRLAAARTFGLPVRSPYGIIDMANDAAALLTEIGVDRAHIVGASMGGMIAQHFAHAHPQRTLSLTSIMSTTSQLRYAFPKWSLMKLMLAPAPAPNLEARIAYGLEFWRAVGSPGDRASDAELIADIRSWFERSPDLSGRSRQLAAVIAERSRVRLLGRIDAPALVVHGTDDPLIPCAAGRATARALQRAKFLPLDGMGHDLRPRYTEIIARELTDLARVCRDAG